MLTQDALAVLPPAMLTSDVKERIERPLHTYVGASLSDQAKAEIAYAKLVHTKGIEWLNEHKVCTRTVLGATYVCPVVLPKIPQLSCAG
jgi:hypothetical protein